MSWIHEEDIVRAYVFALETGTLQGVVNAAAPEQTTYLSLLSAFGKALRRKVFGTIPAWILRAKLGEAFAALTISQQAAPKRLLDKGFVFEYPTLESVVADITNDKKR
jgi:NAD dependent epimerase/dehydratase family enzyme